METDRLRIILPPTYRRAEPADTPSTGGRTTRTRRWRSAGESALTSDEAEAIAEALQDQEIELVATEVFEPTEEETPPSGRRRRGAPSVPDRQEISVELSVGEEEEAVLLLEQDGMYSWKLPDASTSSRTPGRRRRGEAAPEVEKQVSFRIEVFSQYEPTTRRRGAVTDFLFGRMRVFVLKFVAVRATEGIMARLERHVREGIIAIENADPQTWRPVEDPVTLSLPEDRPARLLLLIHGTFSSTLGAFGALAAYPWGSEFLSSAHERYDAVIGFDHRTLSLDPNENAVELLRRLRALCSHAPQIDVVTHSRGGLVFRSLVEHVLPSAAGNWKPHFGRVIFVGVPNNGTTLADPENWQALIDLYTNIAAAVFRMIGIVPQINFAATLLKELIQGLAALVKYIVQEAIDRAVVPGLAAMQPGGAFIEEINRTQAGQPGVDTTFYCAITAEFEVRVLDGEQEPRELPRRLLTALADRILDRLHGGASDLVVNTGSMQAIDSHLGTFIKDQLDFGRTPQVYHTNYFTRPEVTDALRRWLQLESPGTLGHLGRRRGSHGRFAGAAVPVAVSTDALVTTSDTTVEELRDALTRQASRYVIVRRDYEGKVLNYAYAQEEVLEFFRSAGPDEQLLDALNMHEFQASPEQDLTTPTPPREPSSSGQPTTGRAVVLDGGRPVGVVPESTLIPSSTELARRADERGGHLEMANGGGDPARSDSRSAAPPRRRRTRGTSRRSRRDEIESEAPPPAAGPAAEEAEEGRPATVECHFYAEMDQGVVVGEKTTLTVVVSRESVEAASDRLTASEGADVEAHRKIILDIRPRRNFEVVGERRAEIEPPEPDAPIERFFDLRPTHAGEGEVWVTARQGQVSLLTLRLKAVIVGSNDRPERRRMATAEADVETISFRTEPMCQLRIFERDRGDEIAHEYELEIPGKVFDRYISKPFKANRNDYINGLYKEIEDRWLSTDEDEENFVEELRAMGGSLFSQLFPDELQRDIWEHRGDIESIQVISTEPFIPWELVHLKEPGEALPDETLFLAQMGLVRWLHGSWFPDRLRVREGRARYVIPDYPDQRDKLPEAQKEIAFLENRFGAAAVEPQPKPLRQLLRGPGAFDLLHFACHGLAEGDRISHAVLVLQGRREDGRTIDSEISVTTVQEHSRLEGEDGTRPIVVLNACQVGRLGFQLTKVGGFADAFLGRGAGAFVGPLWSVGDFAARVFTETLYQGLLDGRALAEAAITARRAASKDGDSSWLAYAVYGHPHARLELS